MGLFGSRYDIRTPTCIRVGRTVGRVTSVKNDRVHVYLAGPLTFVSLCFDDGTEAAMVADRIANQIAEGKRDFVVDIRGDE